MGYIGVKSEITHLLTFYEVPGTSKYNKKMEKKICQEKTRTVSLIFIHQEFQVLYLKWRVSWTL